MISTDHSTYNFKDAKVVAINDPCVSTEEMVRMIKYDSNYGQFQGEVEVGNNPSLPVVHHCSLPRV